MYDSDEFLRVIRGKEQYYQTKINFSGNVPPASRNDDWLWKVLFELVNNCGQKHPNEIIVEFSPGRIYVTDSVVEPNADQKIILLKSFIESHKPHHVDGIGGVGLHLIGNELDKHNGRIDYANDGGRISATVVWP